jgi:hypothetical protein
MVEAEKRDGGAPDAPPISELERRPVGKLAVHCAERLPRYHATRGETAA